MSPSHNSFSHTALDFVKQGIDAAQQTAQVVMNTIDVNQACRVMGNAALATAQHVVNNQFTPADRLMEGLMVSDPMAKLMQGDKSSSQDQAQAQAMKQRASEVMARVASGSVSEGDLASLHMDVFG